MIDVMMLMFSVLVVFLVVLVVLVVFLVVLVVFLVVLVVVVVVVVFFLMGHMCLYVLYMFSGKFQIIIKCIICYKFMKYGCNTDYCTPKEMGAPQISILAPET